MRRCVLFFLGLLFLQACARPRAGLAPEEVLRRAAQRNQELRSAQFSLAALFDGGMARGAQTVHAILHADGRMQDGGRQLAFSTTAQVQRPDQLGESITGTADIVIAGENEVYVNITSLNLPVPQQFLGHWWLFPGHRRGSGGLAITPDPHIFRAQEEVVTVTKNDGIVSVAGGEAYHLHVVVDEPKLLQYLEKVAEKRGETLHALPWQTMLATTSVIGELWIDVSTFNTKRLQWSIISRDGTRPFHLTFSIDFSAQNQAEPIQPPEGARPFPPLPALPDASWSASALEQLLLLSPITP